MTPDDAVVRVARILAPFMLPNGADEFDRWPDFQERCLSAAVAVQSMPGPRANSAEAVPGLTKGNINE